ncbi:DUF6988 family protein [Dyella psychrodurans]|uniref:DUF6988 family protein n=1 Tax=Dyella psychrodurans TaxID=1927960 RepID=UPI0011C05214|nr:hypothetical protein [Dyella psychrodurans]
MQEDVDVFLSACERADELAVWAANQLHGREGQPGLRNKLAAAALGLAIDLHATMVMLAKKGAFSAIFCLARSILESYVTGFWLLYIASDQQIESFNKGKTSIKHKRVLMNEVIGHKASRITDYKLKELTGLLDGLTHGGIKHLAMRLSGNFSGAIYKHRYVAGLLDLSSWIACMAAVDVMVKIMAESELAASMHDKGNEIFLRNRTDSELPYTSKARHR